MTGETELTKQAAAAEKNGGRFAGHGCVSIWHGFYFWGFGMGRAPNFAYVWKSWESLGLLPDFVVLRSDFRVKQGPFGQAFAGKMWHLWHFYGETKT